jgi:hypothetical protein
VLDSLLYTFADEFVPAATCATLAAASVGDGVIVCDCAEDDNYKLYESTENNDSAEKLGYR